MRFLWPIKSETQCDTTSIPDFVILAMQRTGSNMLVSALDAHPEVTCLGELFRNTPDWMKRDGYRGALTVLDSLAEKYRNDAYRKAHGLAFLEEVRALCPKGRSFGFKLMLAQAPSLMAQLIGSPHCRKVLLRRDNILAAYSSERIAQKTGQGAARKTDVVKQAKVHFDAKDFARFRRGRERMYGRAMEQLETSGQPYLNVEYLQIARGDRFSEILEFLGVDATVNVEPNTAKRNPSYLPERFDNPKEVEDYLASAGLEQWLREE